MTVHRSLWITLALCLAGSAGPALAQDAGGDADPAATPPPDGSMPAPPDGGVAASSRWPRSVIARQLTLPKGLVQVGGDLGFNNDFSTIGLNLVGGYGISDDLEVTGFYGFTLKDFEIKGNLDVDVGYKLLRGAADGKLEVIGRGRLGYNIAGEAANPLRLGAQVQYNVTDKIALISPGQQIVVGLEEGMGGGRPTFLQIPVAVGYQATPELYVQLDTTLAQIEITDSGNAFFGADTTPLAVTGIYNAMPALDVIASIGLNLTPPDIVDPMTMMRTSGSVGDSLTFLVGARYYVGQL
jgi:hypothetical protein